MKTWIPPKYANLWVRDVNPDFRYNTRYDELVKCSACDQGMPMTSVLDIRGKMACPFCNRFIKGVRSIVRWEGS